MTTERERPRRSTPGLLSKVVVAGLSTSATMGLVTVMADAAHSSPSVPPPPPEESVADQPDSQVDDTSATEETLAPETREDATQTSVTAARDSAPLVIRLEIPTVGTATRSTSLPSVARRVAKAPAAAKPATKKPAAAKPAAKKPVVKKTTTRRTTPTTVTKQSGR